MWRKTQKGQIKTAYKMRGKCHDLALKWTKYVTVELHKTTWTALPYCRRLHFLWWLWIRSEANCKTLPANSGKCQSCVRERYKIKHIQALWLYKTFNNKQKITRYGRSLCRGMCHNCVSFIASATPACDRPWNLLRAETHRQLLARVHCAVEASACPRSSKSGAINRTSIRTIRVKHLLTVLRVSSSNEGICFATSSVKRNKLDKCGHQQEPEVEIVDICHQHNQCARPCNVHQ